MVASDYHPLSCSIAFYVNEIKYILQMICLFILQI